MGPPLTQEKRNAVTIKKQLSVLTKTIYVEVNIPLHTVQEYIKNLNCFGAVRPPKHLCQGRPRKIAPEMEDVPPLPVVFHVVWSRKVLIIDTSSLSRFSALYVAS